MTRRRILAIVVPLAAAGILAGCGGGGGSASSGTSSADPAAGAGSSYVSQGVSADQSAAQAVAALGSPEAVDPSRAGETLGGYDDFGTPKDVFVQQVKDAGGASGTNGAESTPGVTPGAVPGIPTVSPPYTGAPGTTPSTTPSTTPGTTTPPASSVPTSTPNALEADFDISGEPVVAREGDAMPPDTQQFTVKTIGATTVMLQLNAGLLPSGKDYVTLAKGESITLVNQTAKQSYKIKLIDIRSVG